MVMIARLKGIPLTRDEGDIRISLEKLPRSLNVFVNKAVRRHPMTIVLRQVRPNNATFTQGNFCWGASSNSISADGLNELSMKRVLLPLVSVGHLFIPALSGLRFSRPHHCGTPLRAVIYWALAVSPPPFSPRCAAPL